MRARTGLVIDAYFSGDQAALHPRRGARRAGSAPSAASSPSGRSTRWLLYRLTGGRVHATEYSNASRTMLYNIHERRWDDAAARARCASRARCCPRCASRAACFGETDPRWLGAAIPIAGMAGDQQAALFGQGCFAPGRGQEHLRHRLLPAAEHRAARRRARRAGSSRRSPGAVGGRVEYALEGSVFVAGAAVQWLRDGLRLVGDAAETEAAARSVPDTAGVYVVPAFVGLGAPYWDEARARHDRRHHARHHARAPDPRHARVDRLPDARRGRVRARRRRAPARRRCASTAAPAATTS